MDRFPIIFLVATLIALVSGGRDEILRLPSETSRFFQAPAADENDEGTRWAVLIAGSNGYWNYRHQDSKFSPS
ncbi:legumain [Vigna unguiculata]|uniref:Legumain n=1 Tax=Vigna unguiculata TaxID=3917 RepID=A0A4D6NVS0_VIGUN|nr:legumain [Vigna unguiculata]